MKILLNSLAFIFLAISPVYSATECMEFPTGTPTSCGGSDLTASNSHTIGDGSSGDVTLTFDGDAGTDGTMKSDVSEDIFVFSFPIQPLSSASLSLTLTGSFGFDNDYYAVGRGAYLFNDGTSTKEIVACDSPKGDAGQVCKSNGDGTASWAADSTGTGLGTNLSSSTNDILSDSGTLLLGGTGNTNNEKITCDFETTANEVACTSSTGANVLDFSTFTIQGLAFEAAASATPTMKFYDSDGTDADINGQIDGNLTDTGSGSEDFDIFVKQQIAGTLTTTATFDADGSITFSLPVIASTVNIDLLDGVGAVDMDYGSPDITDHTFITDGTGDAEIVLPINSISPVELTTERKCFGWFDPADADDDAETWIFRYAATVTNVACRVSGGTSLAVVGGDGTNSFESITCDADGAVDDGSITNATFTAGEVFELDLGAPSGTVPSFLYCIDFTTTSL